LFEFVFFSASGFIAHPPPSPPLQVADFVDRYMPAYKAYLPGLRAKGPTTAAPGKLLVVAVDEGRGLAPVQPAPAV
jgi:D-glycerate 3-kinase